MEKHMHLWRGVDKLSYTFGDKPNGIICRLITIKDHIFVATTSNNLYHGEVSFLEDSPPSLVFKRAQFDVVDIASNSEHLFIVDNNGHVLKINPQDMSVVDTIILKEEVKCCSHGCKQESEVLKVKSIAVNDQAAMFVTENGQLWASGNQSQIDINSKEPKKVKFFEGRTVFTVSCGSNFNVVAVRKTSKAIKDDTDSENELDEEVFVNSCPQCLNTVLLSPTSLTSSDTCPTGLHAQQFSEDRSTTSISALSITSKEHDTVSPAEVVKKEQTSKISRNGEESTNNSADSDKEEKKNVIFINTEAAKQFLTRQLSWVSSYGSVKEDISLENVEKPTRLIKQNVSNVANLVYEGVKNVGGKVVTLSRHMSGSSDINEFKDDSNEHLETHGEELSKPTATSLALSLRCEEFPWSSSTGSSEHELSQQGLNERINTLTRAGSNILSTELWAWGDIQYGQLGVGDTMIHSRPVLVGQLSNIGLRKVSCGAFHILALTLDGKVFAWGRNNHKQVTLESNEFHSAPQLFTTKLSPNERAKDMAAGTFHSLIMMHHGLYFIGQSSKAGEMFHLDIETSNECSSRQIFSSGKYSCCSLINEPEINISEDLINDQIFLEEILMVYKHLIKPFQKKGGAMQESNVYETLCRCYTELLSFSALNVISLWDYFNHIGEAYEVTVVANVEEYITVYKYYLNAICDVTSLSGFTYIAKIIEVPQIITNLFSNKLKSNGVKKVTNEVIITMALQHPLRKLNRYKNMILNLIKCNGTRMGVERLQEALIKWEQICDLQEKRQKEAETTKLFWESSGKLGELLRSPNRRLIRESRTHPISILNSGRFTTHWFVLLTDIFIHVIGTFHMVHPLQTLWVEVLPDSETVENAMSIIVPEDTFVLYTPTASERNEWLQALQNAIKCSLQRVIEHVPPIVRSSSFSFTKHSVFKDAKYTGRWLNGKPHGSGKLEWSDGRIYTGQFHKGVIHGTGKMEIPSQGVYEGQWKDGQQNGYGTMKYNNGDFYEGYFKDGLPHGHGVKKEGHFMASVASVYIGEWVSGVKQGYGIMDDIMTGEKYLGSWSNGMKHGCGLIVTLDGIYYEGVFMQDVLTGHGVMVFEDGTHYEGEFKSAGIFYGKGTLTFRSGDRLEGNMNGVWNEGVKVIATLHMNKAGGNVQSNSKPLSFGKLCVSPDQKWKAIFRQCYQQLGAVEPGSKTTSTNDKSLETQRVWQNVASIITKSRRRTLQQNNLLTNTSIIKEKDNEVIDELDKIPCYGKEKLGIHNYNEIHKYLIRAFESQYHPLGCLLTEVAAVYTATYGGVRVHPLLLSHAVSELHSITSRIYEIVTLLFPALPRGEEEYVLEAENEEESQVISAVGILYPILLPRVHSALFVLYALHNKKEDDAYWERLMKWNKQSDITLMTFLDIDQKFWKNANVMNLSENGLQYQNEPYFNDAIETLQQLKTTFSPLEKLLVVRNTFEQMTQAVQKQLGSTYLWTMDELIPVFCFVVVRASVLQLGSEIHFIEDFMEGYLQNGELGIMFATLKACYYQILQEKINVGD
ncbi:amyotrophic lateral sclerosis 2 isoform X2 [Ptiloglossa arizonensis]|uniref:amyotrophic lateral sclerosis 2 isoform X2 n=1 Tax=Ptiloglossa arizonensis TaxID=3350558 RepID=UPI003F9F82D0